MEEKGSLVLYTIKFDYDQPINEEHDLISPDGVSVAWTISNFKKEYHPDWVHLKPQPPLPKKSKKGRPKKPVRPKIIKSNSGDNTVFAHEITFGVIVGDKVYNTKIFRKNSINISSIKYEDENLVRQIIDICFAFINKHKPEMNIRLKSINMGLKNYRNNITMPTNYVLNIYLMSRELKKKNVLKIKDEYKTMVIHFNNDEIYCRASLKYKDKTYQCKINPNGNVFIFGGNDDEISEAIFRHIAEIAGDYAGIGFPSLNKKELQIRNS
ncbi:MAG: hypothetical protein CMM93_04205 [Rickettsiales bacterium]|nr:hypothetical protein [Rickettsiales bacterium]|tara:strand:- start:2094 stop:2897 length:804 start_codon:yes stop_codon:yes gene_type:complete